MNIEEYLIDDSWRSFLQQQPLSWDVLCDSSPSELLQWLWQTVQLRVEQPYKTLLASCGLLLIGWLVSAVCGSVHRESDLPDLIQTVSAGMIFLLLGNKLVALIQGCSQLITDCRILFTQFVPVYCSVLVACGQVGTATVYHAAFSVVILTASGLLNSWLAPVIRCYGALCVSRSFCGSLRIQALCRLVQKTVYWGLGILASVVAAYLSLQTVLAGAADSMTVKGGKLLANAVPLVGSAVAESVSVLICGLKIVRSAIGIMGIVGILVTFLPVLVDCLLFILICRISAAIAETADNTPAFRLLEGLADTVRLMAIILFLFLLLLVLSVALTASLFHTAAGVG